MAKAAQRASPVRITGPPYMVVEPESSATGPCAVSGDKLDPAGAGLGGLLLEGKISGDSAGVAELEGTLADGTSATAGELAGLPDGDDAGGEDAGVDDAGEFTGPPADGEGVAGEGTGADSLDDGVGAGETAVGGVLVPGDCTGGLAGGCNGEAVGLVFGEAGIVGEIFGDGEASGDFDGDAWGLAGEVAGTAVFAGAGDKGVDLGAGAGALVGCATPEYDTHRNNNNNKETETRLNIFTVKNKKKCGRVGNIPVGNEGFLIILRIFNVQR